MSIVEHPLGVCKGGCNRVLPTAMLNSSSHCFQCDWPEGYQGTPPKKQPATPEDRIKQLELILSALVTVVEHLDLTDGQKFLVQDELAWAHELLDKKAD